MRKLFFIACLSLLYYEMQAQSCFARVSLDRRSVYVQQPFKVTITVLTATWYTAPIEFDNLQVPNAFVLPFDRTQPGMFEYNGKQYAGITFYFIVFPYRAGEFTVPELTVHATTPPEGSSESRRITIKTPVQHYRVKPVPDHVEGNWFVAKSVVLHEHWNKSLSDLKVGDIVERTVTVRARGTLPQFIPALTEKDLDFVNIYPHDPELKDLRNEYDANGELTQSFTYLLEKEGDFVIPPMPVQWWNPNAGKLNSRKLPQHKIHVKANPDLGMVASIRDSLEASQPPIPMAKAEKKPLTIMGLRWYWFVVYALITLTIVYFIVRLMIRVVRHWQKRYTQYKQSETWWFRHLVRSPDSWPLFWTRLYQWWDRVDQPDKSAALKESEEEYDKVEWKDLLRKGNENIYQIASPTDKVDNAAKVEVKHFRKWLRNHKLSSEDSSPSARQREWS